MEFMSSDAQMEVDDKISSARYRCPLSPPESIVSSPKAVKALTPIWSELVSGPLREQL